MADIAPESNGNGNNDDYRRERSPLPPASSNAERNDDRERERSPYSRGGDREHERARDDRDERDDRDRSAAASERRRNPPPPPPGRGEAAPASNVLGCFGLSIRTRDIDLEDEFSRYGRVEKAVIVYDQRSERSRGFGFVTMSTPEEAEICIDKLNGIELHGRNIRVAFSMTQRPHASTPGEYMGVKTEPRGGGSRGGGGGGGYRDGGNRDSYRGGSSRDYGGGRDRDYDRRPSYRDDRYGGGGGGGRRDYDDRDRYPSRRDDRERDYDRGYDRPPPPRRSPSPRRD